jgi:hypothetical protein
VASFLVLSLSLSLSLCLSLPPLSVCVLFSIYRLIYVCFSLCCICYCFVVVVVVVVILVATAIGQFVGLVSEHELALRVCNRLINPGRRQAPIDSASSRCPLAGLGLLDLETDDKATKRKFY